MFLCACILKHPKLLLNIKAQIPLHGFKSLDACFLWGLLCSWSDSWSKSYRTLAWFGCYKGVHISAAIVDPWCLFLSTVFWLRAKWYNQGGLEAMWWNRYGHFRGAVSSSVDTAPIRPYLPRCTYSNTINVAMSSPADMPRLGCSNITSLLPEEPLCRSSQVIHFPHKRLHWWNSTDGDVWIQCFKLCLFLKNTVL